MNKINIQIVLWAVFVLVNLDLEGCTPKKKVEVETQFCMSDTLMQSIKIETVDSSKYNINLVLPGAITFNEDKVIKIFPLVSGIVEEVKVQLGDAVKKGQVLAILKSSEMAGFSNDLVNAQANREISNRNLIKTKELFLGGLSSQLDVLAAEKDLEKSTSDLNRIKEVLRVNGSSSNGSNYIIKSPIDGYIVDKQINPNTQIRVDNGNNLFMISNLDQVWVVANVYEADISKVSKGQLVSITTLSYPDKVFKGKIDRIYNILDPVSKTMKIKVILSNPGFLLKPQMFANVSVKTKAIQSKIGIPSTAIIFDNSKNYVMVFKDKCNIETREIKIGYSDGSVTYIDEGLILGDKIITHNPIYVYQALNQ